MTPACHQCGFGVEADDMFCRACGARQRPAGQSEELAAGDRRQLTVMFCDLVDSTAMAARLDPEDVQTVLRAYQELAATIIGNVDGHVAQYLGDGVLVYLGYPAAHEDDPARAVSAALEIAREVPLLSSRLAGTLPALSTEVLQVRIGIHTGPVVIGTIGSRARSEQLASGKTVNIAARLAAAAPAGGVVISEATARRTSGLFVTEALGEQQLKGLAEPVAAFRPMAQRGTRSRLAAWGAGSGRQLVGRDPVMAQVMAAWRAIGARNREARAAMPRTILLRGEPGIGKSRVVQALRQQLAAEPHGWIACHGGALQQGRDFFPIVEAVRASLDLEGGEPDAVALARLEAGLSEIGINAGPNTDRLAVLLGLAGATARLTADDRGAAIALIADWWLRLARETPLVLALEDLHWFDPSSLELISHLLACAGDAPIFVIGTLRPEWQSPWPDATVIDLPPLSAADIAEIVANIVGNTASSRALRTLIERSDGVPLFAEELAQAFAEHRREASEQSGVPASLQDSIMARLDRLGTNKRLVQLGALLGRTFSHELIAAAADLDDAFLLPGLAEITASGILQRSGVPPRAIYSFRHALLQDAASDSLLRQQYRRDNGVIAVLLRDRFPEVADADPGRVARHFAEAGAARDAIYWYRQAGQQAERRAAYSEAEAIYARAIALAEALVATDERDDPASELYAEMGHILQMTQGYAAPATREALARAALPDRQIRDRAFLQRERERFQATLTRGAYSEARAQLEAVQRRWRGEIDDPFFQFFRLGGAIQIGYFTGDLAAVEAAFAEMEPWVDDHGHNQPAGNTISAIGVAALCAAWRGDGGEAHRRIKRALDFADRTGNPYDRAMSLHYLSVLHPLEDDAAAATMVGRQLLGLAEAQGFAYLAALVRCLICWGEARLGKTINNAAIMRNTLDEIFAAGGTIAGATQLNRLADVELIEGRPEAALATVEEALAFNPEELVYRPANLLTRALIMAETDPDAARADLEEALGLAESQGAHGISVQIANALAPLLIAAGEVPRARAVLAAELRHGAGNPRDLAHLHDLLAQLQPKPVAASR